MLLDIFFPTGLGNIVAPVRYQPSHTKKEDIVCPSTSVQGGEVPSGRQCVPCQQRHKTEGALAAVFLVLGSYLLKAAKCLPWLKLQVRFQPH